MFPQLFDSVPDALIVVDDSGRIVLANRQAETLFGYPDGLTGLAVEMLMPVGVRERHHAHRAGYMAAPRTRAMGDSGMALIGQRRDGAQFPLEIALSPVETDAGLRYLASIRDISESQRARQALTRARYDALVARLGQQALESASEESVIAGLPGLLAEALAIPTVVVVLVGERGELDIRAAVGLDAEMFDAAQLADAARLIAAGELRIVEDRLLDPQPFPLAGAAGSGAAIPLPDRDRAMGALVAWSGHARRFDHDAVHLLQSAANLLAALVQRRRTEEQLAHSQRLDAIGKLTGGIAHDFNNMLTVVSGSLQLLEMECSDRPEAGELIASALRSVQGGAELTAKLLAFARRQRLSPAAVVPVQVLRSLEMMLRRTLGETIRLRVECPDAVPAAYADPAQLDAALLNLALNARDAMPRGGDITVSAGERWVGSDQVRPGLRAGHYIVFSVADTGHGMTAESLARAIEPFYTTKGHGRGSGLGLSMVYGFVEQSGGHLHIESRLGYGSLVELYLPATTAQPAAIIAGPATPTSSGDELILVVEDEPAVRAIAAAFVRSLGYRVVAVADADEALAAIDAEPRIALMFTDVMLGPGMSGKELAVAAHRLRPRLPVLLTSGYEETTADGADGLELLRKPYQRAQLAAALQRNLRAAEALPSMAGGHEDPQR